MILLLYGPNEYAREQKVRELIISKRAQYPHAPYSSFLGDDEMVCERMELFVFESGLFSGGKKIALVRNPAACVKQNEDLWKRICMRSQNDEVLLIFSQQTSVKSSSRECEWTAGAEYKAQFFQEYTDIDAIRILLDEAQKLSCSLDRAAAMKIYSYASKDMFGAVQEVRRLTLLNTPITPTFLKSLPEYGESMAVYEFAHTICQSHAELHRHNTDKHGSTSSLAKRLTLWEYMRAQRVDPYLLFGYLAKMARKKSLINALARADELVKSGRLEIEQALEEIVIRG